MPATPGTAAWPPSRPSVPTSRATRVTSRRRSALSWSTIVLSVSLSCRISPLTFTVIFFDRSPRAMAVATSAMLRTWAVRLLRHEVDVVGEVLPRAADARHLRLAAELAFGADLARHARHLAGEGVELVDHRVDGVLELEDFAAARSTVILRERSPRATAVVTSAMLRTWAVRLPAIALTSRSGPSTCRRRRARPPGRRACLRCRPRARRASLPRRTSAAGRPSC